MIFDNRELGITENCNSYTRSAGSDPRLSEKRFLKAGRRGAPASAKRIRAHDGCLGIRRLRRTRKTATSCGEPSTGVDPQVSEWGNPAALIGGHPRMNA